MFLKRDKTATHKAEYHIKLTDFLSVSLRRQVSGPERFARIRRP